MEVESAGGPWVFNVAGASHSVDGYYAAYAFLQRHVRSGQHIDVSCMQLNTRYHLKRFRSAADMLDPLQNVRAAAEFLTELKNRYETWERAAGAYHNQSSAERNRRYRCKLAMVLAAGQTFPYCS